MAKVQPYRKRRLDVIDTWRMVYKLLTDKRNPRSLQQIHDEALVISPRTGEPYSLQGLYYIVKQINAGALD